MTALSAGRRRVRRHRIVAAVLVSAVVLNVSIFLQPGPVLVWNASASAPIGLYRVRSTGIVRRGDLVLARTPDSVRRLAAERRYLPATVPLVKRVAALDGDTVCAIDRAVTIDGRHVADQRAADRLGRPLPAWRGCRTLGRGDIFLLMAGVPDSFDGRYFGLVPANAIIGKLVPLWLR
jgi:conjugative transfer signal peptidase TraF